MQIDHINPPNMQTPTVWSHLIVTTGGRTVYLAGQAPYDADDKLVGAGDHYAQAKQVFENINTALAAVGATAENIVKCTMYCVGANPEVIDAFVKGMNDAYGPEGMPPTASTFVGVERLGIPEILVEVDAIAVID